MSSDDGTTISKAVLLAVIIIAIGMFVLYLTTLYQIAQSEDTAPVESPEVTPMEEEAAGPLGWRGSDTSLVIFILIIAIVSIFMLYLAMR